MATAPATQREAESLPQLEAARQFLTLSPAERAKGVEIVGPWGSAKALAAAQAATALGASLLYVTPGRIEAEAAYEDLCTFLGEDACALFPAWEVLPTDVMKPADDIVAERMNALKRLAVALQRGELVCAAVSVRSLMQRVVNRDHLIADTIQIEVGKEYDLEDLALRLVKMGYERELLVEARGELSIRGGIFDVFPISSELPYRIEFFGDEVESIRRFEPETQRSVDQLREVQILPRSEKSLLEEQASEPGKLSAVTDYFGENTIVVFDEPAHIREEAERLEAQFGESAYMATWDDVERHVAPFARISLAQVAHAAQEGAKRIRTSMTSMSGWAGHTDGFWSQLELWDGEGYTVQIYCNNTGERRRLLELLEDHGYRIGHDRFDLRLSLGRIRSGFASANDKFAVLSERELFGRKYVRRVRRRFEAGAAITAFSDVRPGDYVVHVDHGIGRYLGLKRFSGKAGDFLSIQYAGNDIMYVPVTHIDLIQKYIGGDGVLPKIDKLGGSTWAKTKSRVKKAVRDMTDELLKLYASREGEGGYPCGPDTHWQNEFEDAFEYDETADQLRAITEVKRDMESARPMERLLCGDVGFGKTEVALRAAFKTVMDRKQVAILVPTTILAEQHFNTFQERLADYPITVEMLSRFRTAAEQRRTIERLKSGEVDIVIGTHRLVSKDVGFKDLGLVILDEEQRFGVAHKERLKHLKNHVDVLTLSATPIPRTLHMSLMGVRDMSLISTAPNDRLPIHTCIEVFDEDLVKEAIERELGREGQVFYLHNRVQSIEKVAGMVKRLVPRAKVGVGHGQMREHDLEDVMGKFIRKELDVLVCTTIIGSGLDIPNANTIIVDRADMFGLAELYQIRGRVGRYKHRAFAYLLVPGDKALSEDAQKRLKALEEFSTLGAGFRIAMRDLEIRGCGNLLGGEQSGNISAVGYDTYTQLIQEAVQELKGNPPKRHHLPLFDIATDAHIPEAYVPLESQKITLYKRISGILSVDDVDDMFEELKDRFGAPPAPVRRLLDIMRVRALAAEAGVSRIAASKEGITFTLRDGALTAGAGKKALTQRLGGRVTFAWKDTPSLSLTVGEGEDPVAAAKRACDAMLAVSEEL